jgi:hypothetical protein
LPLPAFILPLAAVAVKYCILATLWKIKNRHRAIIRRYLVSYIEIFKLARIKAFLKQFKGYFSAFRAFSLALKFPVFPLFQQRRIYA